MGGNLAEIRGSREKAVAGIDPNRGCLSSPFAGEFRGHRVIVARGARKDFGRTCASLGAEPGIVAFRGKKVASRAGSQETCGEQDSAEAEACGPARLSTRRLKTERGFRRIRLKKTRDKARLATHSGLIGWI